MDTQRTWKPGEVVALLSLGASGAIREWARKRVALPRGDRGDQGDGYRRYDIRDVCHIALIKACSDAGVGLMASGRFAEAYRDALLATFQDVVHGAWDPERLADAIMEGNKVEPYAGALVITPGDIAGEEEAAFASNLHNLGDDLHFMQARYAILISLLPIARQLAARIAILAKLPPSTDTLRSLDPVDYFSRRDDGSDDRTPEPEPINPTPPIPVGAQ